MSERETPPQMNRNTAGVLAIVAYALSIAFGLLTSLAVELDKPWSTIIPHAVASFALLMAGSIWAGKATRK